MPTKTSPSLQQRRTANQEVLAQMQAIAPHNAPKPTTLHKALAFGQQRATYQETLQVGTAKLRVMITRDSYDFQSSARIDAFSPTELKWNPIAFIPHGIMATNKALAYWERATEASFKADRDNLLDQARAILA